MATIPVYVNTNLDNVYQSAFLGIGLGTNGTITSIDGRTLTNLTNLPSSLNWYGAASGFVNEIPIIVAVSSVASAAYSYDNVTWTASTMPSALGWTSIAYGGGYFCAVASGPTTDCAYTNNGGVTWQQASVMPSGAWKCIASDGGNNFVAVCSSGTTIAAYSSNNGRNWTQSNLPQSGDWRSLAFGGGTFVTLSYNSANAYYSTDLGVTWNYSSLPATKNWISVAYGNGIFVAINNSDNVIAISNDLGVSWTTGTLNIAGGTSICFHPDLKVFLVGSTTTSWGWSADGYTWLTKTVTTARSILCVCPTFIKWASADLLTINEGAIITCNTNQTKFLKTITIADGRLDITNSSTSNPLVFALGRSSAATINSIIPSSALGSMTIQGNWIEIGTGNFSSNQTMTSPFSDFVPCLWVETGAGTGIYERWLNVTGFMTDSGADFAPLYNKFNAVSSGVHGNVFIQNETNLSTWVFQIGSGSTTINSRVVSVSSTTGIYSGAQIVGTNIPTNSIVDKVINSTQLLINQTCTATGTEYTFTIYNPYQSQLGKTITFGDGINGNKVPLGAKVRIPNIMFTDLTPVNLMTNSDVLTGSINLNSGGSLTASICSFDEAYLNLSQGDLISLTFVGSRTTPVIVKCFNLTMNDVGIAHNISRMFLSAANGYSRKSMAISASLSRFAFQYIDNAVLTNIDYSSYFPVLPTGDFASLSTVGAMISIEYSKNVTASSIRLFNLGFKRAYLYGFVILFCKNISISSSEIYNTTSKIAIGNSVNVTFDGITHSNGMWNDGSGVNAATTRNRIIIDPSTGNVLSNGVKYWLKIVSFREGWKDRNKPESILESMPISFTPYDAQNEFHLTYFGVYPTQTVANSVTLTWLSQGVVSSTRSFDIFRSTSENFTQRDSTTLLFTTATATTVTYVDNGAGLLSAPLAGTTYYYVLRKYHYSTTVASCTTTINSTNITTTNNFNRAISITSNYFYSGENQITNTAFSFTALQIGMTVNGTGIQSGTVITDIDELGQIITISKTVDQNGFGRVLTFNFTDVRWAVTGTGIPTLTHISSVNSNTSITLDRQATASGTVTLTFLAYTETAEMACIPKLQESLTNYCFQSDDFTNASWVKTNTTVTANTRLFPYNGALTLTATADRLTATAGSATTVQTVTGLTIGIVYIAFVTLATDIIPFTQTSVSGSITFGTTTTNYTLTDNIPIVVSAVFTATATSHTFTIRINTSGQYIYAGGACVENTSSILTSAYIPTTTAAVTANADRYQFITSRVYPHRGFNGLEFQTNAAPVGILFGEIHVGTTPNFTPSQSTLWGIPNTYSQSANGAFEIANASDTITLKNFSQFREGWYGNSFFYFSGLPTNISLKTGTIKFNGGNSRLVNYVLANSTQISDFDIVYPREQTSGYPLITSVNAGGNHILQNIRSNRYSVPIVSNAHGMILKGISAGYQSLQQSSTSAFSLFSAIDGLTSTYTAVYDTFFNELCFSSSTGALALSFTNSPSLSSSYYSISSSVNSSSPKFNDTGRLYMKYAGDSITFTWPHKIFGVSGFRGIRPRFNGLDTGSFVQSSFGIKAEYSVDTGSGFGSFKEIIPLNLSSETLSASSGFYLKIKLTAVSFMKCGTITSEFVIGETITGVTSLATAIVDNIEYISGTGTTLRLSSIVGNWIPGEIIKSGATNRATNVATNNFAIGPQVTSYISGFEFFTNVDQTVKYPTEVYSLILTGLKTNSEVRCYIGVDPSTSIEIGGIESSGTEFTLTHSSAGIAGYIQIASLGYQNITLPWTYQNTNQTIPIQQQIDRQYQNP